MAEPIETHESATKVVVFTVKDWPEIDPTYNTVLLRLPGGYEARVSPTDAQRLGQRLNRAGGGKP